MGNQDFPIGIGDALVIAIIVDVPETSDDVVHDEIASSLESGYPILAWAVNGAYCSGRSSVLGGVADGDPTVVHQVRKEIEQVGQDAGGGHIAHGILVEGCGRDNVDLAGLTGKQVRIEGLVNQGADGRQESIRLGQRHEQSIRGLP